MSRSLRLLLAALLFAAVEPALAGPNDPFRASAPGALSSSQRGVLLALDGGRYAIEGGFVLDSRGTEPKKPLTVAEVELLLRGPEGRGSGTVVAAGAEKVRPVLSVPKPPSGADFDGGRGRGGLAGGPAGAIPLVKDPALLHAKLLRRLTFTGTPKEREAIALSLSAVLETRIGRELAAQFVAENASAVIRLDDFEGSQMTTENGKKRFQGLSADADTLEDPPKVTLNRHYLDSDPAWRRVSMAGTLAHELFGHAFEAQRARKAGLPLSVQYYYRGDELGSQLIDWIVQTELAGKVLDGDPDYFLADPGRYYKSLWPMHSYYAVTLSPKEMADPAAALRPRLKHVRENRAATHADREKMKAWGPIRDHFIEVHGIAAKRFAPVNESLSTFEIFAADRLKSIDEVEKNINETIAAWSAKGSTEPAELKSGAKSGYIAAFEARLEARRKELLRLRAEKRVPAPGATPAGKVPAGPSDAPIDLDALDSMYNEDRDKNPEHWKK